MYGLDPRYPHVNFDTDGDCYPDREEYWMGTNPTSPDKIPVIISPSSNFAVYIASNQNMNIQYSDLDWDGLYHKWELDSGLRDDLYIRPSGDIGCGGSGYSYIGSADSDGNGILDPNEDWDGDGLTNLREMHLGRNPKITMRVFTAFFWAFHESTPYSNNFRYFNYLYTTLGTSGCRYIRVFNGFNGYQTLNGENDVSGVIHSISNQITKEDTLIMYIGGHGGNKDITISPSDDGSDNCRLTSSELDNYLDLIECWGIVVMIHACHSGSFIDAYGTTGDIITGNNDLMDDPSNRNRIVFTACRGDETQTVPDVSTSLIFTSQTDAAFNNRHANPLPIPV